MTVFLRPFLELTVVIPGLLLAYLPLNAFLKHSFARLLCWVIPVFLGLSILGGLLCRQMQISTGLVLLFMVLAAIAVYMKTLHVSVWKSGSVALAVCAVFACLNSISRALNAVLLEELNLPEHELWFRIPAALLYNFRSMRLICVLYFPIFWKTPWKPA